MGGSKTDLKPVNIPLLGLGGAPVTPEGMVELDLELGIEMPQEDGTEGILAEPTRKLGVDWPDEHREAIIARIKQYVEEFTNKPEDIGGVDPKIISHKLNVDAKCKPVKQKKRTFSLEKQIAIRDEVEKLLKAGFIRKVDYPEWLANVVLIKKSNEECNTTFEELKVYLSTPPVLGRPEPGEILYLYLSVNDETAAAVLVKEDKGLQTPVYYLSRVLKGPEVAAEKLRRYFEAHIIVVRTNQPLRKALQRPEMSGRLVSWSVQLGGYDIRYEPRPALKAQVLADFIAETTASDQPEEPDEQLLRWVLEVDGASNLDGSGAGVVLKGPHGVTLRSSVKFDFPASNNAAEYEALLIGLRMVNVVKAEHVTIRSDSQLVVCQILGTFEARDSEMRRYVDRVKFFLNKIQELGGKWVIEQVPRLENQEADVLAKAATKAVLQGYYWPLMVRQAEEIVKKCENCQRHQNIRHAPTTEQCPITSPWPFATWGIDILGPFTPTTGQKKFLIVAVDHFTKWLEVEAVSTITEARIRDFFWRQIVCRFGIPRALVTDNGKQFNCRAFKEFCNDLHIDLRFTSVVHPQSNGMTEVTNRTILKGLKARLGEFDRQWLEELPKAMIPVEIGMPTLRVQFFDEVKNEEEQKLCLDLLEERREQVTHAKQLDQTRSMNNQEPTLAFFFIPSLSQELMYKNNIETRKFTLLEPARKLS
ncbi:uncharacterized protein LOC126681705 [Mercurialis annua]|uniref:uncharacterized protein LOC126681705 n=1 Tax=Mercurialis annua TaxID=3986 RepID=UPI00215F7AE5|nr:uncharacterized protein LOC126681705 [Mercurialis annua]